VLRRCSRSRTLITVPDTISTIRVLLDDVGGEWLPVPMHHHPGEVETMSKHHHKFPVEGKPLRVFRPEPGSPYERL